MGQHLREQRRHDVLVAQPESHKELLEWVVRLSAGRRQRAWLLAGETGLSAAIL
ncbi:MAG TPA: hypothetical protein VNM72_06275 [Blastocatellia bacterium]|nr:hypothetical protein [Blastocatellia bacterium]